MLVVVSLAFGLVLEPFWGCIFWACAITVIFYPVQQKILRLIGDKPNRAALITLLLCVLMVILPVLAIGAAFIQEGIAFYDKIEKGEINPDGFIESIRQAFPVVTEFLARFGIQTDGVRERLSGAVEASRLLAKEALSIGQNTFGFILSLCLMLYLTFFLLREGHHLVELMVRALPLGDQRERLLFSKFAEVTRATVKGNLVVAIVQGALGGLIFWLLGLPAPILWGVVMAFLSLLPACWSCFGVVTCFLILVRNRRLGDCNYSGGLWRFSDWSG